MQQTNCGGVHVKLHTPSFIGQCVSQEIALLRSATSLFYSWDYERGTDDARNALSDMLGHACFAKYVVGVSACVSTQSPDGHLSVDELICCAKFDMLTIHWNKKGEVYDSLDAVVMEKSLRNTRYRPYLSILRVPSTLCRVSSLSY